MSAFRLRLLPTAALACALALPALAGPFHDTLTIRASGFSDLFGSTTAPTDPVLFKIGLVFDSDIGDQFDQVNGIEFLGGNLVADAGLAFSYNAASDELTIGGSLAGATGIAAGTNDVQFVIDGVIARAPVLVSADYATGSLAAPGLYESLNGSVELPEPASAVLLASAGLSLLGLRRRR